MTQQGWLASVLSIINKKLDSILTYLYQTQQQSNTAQQAQLDLLLDKQAADHKLILENHTLLVKIAQEISPPLPEPAGFKVSITVNPKGEKTMAPKKAQGVSASITINDDGTASSNVILTDTEGLDITTLTAWPSAVALPTAAFSDASPGPSAYSFAQAPTPTLSSAVPGAFVVGTITVNTPPSPLPAGWGQNVDVEVSIASGLTGQTAPVTEDAGTLSVTADASKPSGFTPVLTEP